MIVKNCKSCGQAFVSDDLKLCIMCTLQGRLTKRELDNLYKLNPVNHNLEKPGKNGDRNSRSSSNRANLKSSTFPSKKSETIKKVKCILCGELIEQGKGKMEEHKYKKHGERLYTPSPETKKKESVWVTICQGGLPSLGKKRS